jgi:N-methylhydantoinase A
VLAPPAPASGAVGDARIGERRAYFAPAGFVATALYDRARLPLDARVAGPAIVEQADTTSVIPPGHVAVVEASGNLRIRRA